MRWVVFGTFPQSLHFIRHAMKTTAISICLAASLAFPCLAAEPAPAIPGLEEAAEKFVAAYNQRDAAAIAALFTEDGEMTNLSADDIISGRAAIQARYEAVFADTPPKMALEVTSVRLVAPDLAIEDGTVHLTPSDDQTAPPRSNGYCAVLRKNSGGIWQIASTRDLTDTTDAGGQIEDLAEILKGEWTCQTEDGVRLDWDKSGKFLIGDMLTTTSDAEPQDGSIRIGWDAARKSIVSWMFDAVGGFTTGVWTPTDDGWLIRSEGTTGDGEILTASQKLTAENKETLLWTATNRVIGGEAQPDKTLRIVRQAPEPSAEPAGQP